MIHITEQTALKSDSDRSLRSYYNSLKDRINNANIDVTELTLRINTTLDQIDYMAEKLEGFREELLDYIEEERGYLGEKGKSSLDGTLIKIREVLEGDDIKDIRNEIENESKCLGACQACYVSTYNVCTVSDTPFCDYTTCVDCVSKQAGCNFCDSDQNTCVVADNPCSEEYTSACSSCYAQLFNNCQQDQISCDHAAGCANCQNNVHSCGNCQNNVGTCSNCYGGSVGTCGEGQVNPCGSAYQGIFCNTNIDPQCSSEFTPPSDCGAGWDEECGRKHQNCPADYTDCFKSDGFCRGGQGKCVGYDPSTGSCNSNYALTCGSGNGTACKTNYDSDSCQSIYQKTCSNNDSVYCERDYGKSCDRQNTVCEGSYNTGNTVCSGGYKSDPYGEVNCKSSYTGASGWETCMEDFDGHACKADYRDLDGVVCQSGYVPGDPPGCQSGYSKGGVTCDDCYGIAYGCGGCYEVDYCSKCDTNQTSCTSCVKGQTTCDACVKGEEGHTEETCSSCYLGCQSVWETAQECFNNQSSMPSPGSCTSCNMCLSYVCSSCNSSCHGCQGGCQSGESCGSSNCGASNCGSANCGTSNCGTGQCNQSGCSTCDDVSACVCSHTGSYGCGIVY